VFAPAIGGNFQSATAAFGAGDKGTPAVRNTGETGVFPPGLVVGGAYYDDQLDLRLFAPTEALKFHYLALSQSALLGLDVLELHLPLDPDALFFTSLGLPGAFASLNLLGQGAVAWPLGGSPSLIGATAFASFLTFDFALTGSAVSNLATITIE